MQKKVWSGLFVLVLLLLTGLVLSWWLAPRWLPPLAENLAQRAGAELVDLEVGRPDWRGWHIDSLRLRTGEFEFSAVDIDISWRCCRQMENSLIAHIDRLHIDQHQPEVVAEQAVFPLALTFVLNSLAQRMPFKELTVTELTGIKDQPAPVELQIIKNKEQLDIGLQANIIAANADVGPDTVGIENNDSAGGGLSSLMAQLESSSGRDSGALLAQLSWQAPDDLLFRINFDGSAVNLQGRLDDRGYWNWSGRYRLQVLQTTDLLAAYFPDLAIPDLRHTNGLEVDQVNISGQLTAAVPDVFGYGEWQLQLNSSLDARIEMPVAMSLSSRLTLAASGVNRLHKLTLDTPRLNGFLEKDLPWQYLPRSWQIAAKEPLNCRFNGVKSGIPTEADQAIRSSFETSMPTSSGDQNAHKTDAVMSWDCLQEFSLHFRSLAADNAPMKLAIDSSVDLSRINNDLISFNIDAQADFNVDGLPKQVTLGGKIAWNPDSFSLQGHTPFKVTWEKLPVGQQITTSGEIYAEKVSVNAQKPGQWQMETDLRGTVTAHFKEEPLVADVWANARLSPQEIYLTYGEVKASSLQLPFEFKWKIVDSNGWLSLKSRGELTDIIDQTGFLKRFDIPAELSLGTLQTTSFFHFRRLEHFTFKGRTQFLLDDWQVNWFKDNGDSLEFNNLMLRGDVQFDQTGLRIISPLGLQLESAEVGIPLRNIFVEISGKVGWHERLTCGLEVNQLHLNSLGGEVSILEPMSVQCPLSSFSVPVSISGIDLGKLVAIESDKVTATGELSGLLPVSFVDGQFLLENGQIEAQGPGNISLADPAYWRSLASGDDSLALTLGILENFNYDTLSVGVDLDKSGLLLLDTQFRGRNPDLHLPGYKGQVVELNLNIENNIVQLLQSANLPAAIEQRLEKAFE